LSGLSREWCVCEVLLLCGVVCSYEQGVLWDVVVSKGDLAICCGLLLIVVAAGCCCLIV
jgi:hypothetical protein